MVSLTRRRLNTRGDLRATAKHSRDPLPVGTVRWRLDKKTNGRTRIRVKYIKVTLTGPKERHWMQYARYVYEKHHGPVPAGKRVLQKNGDLEDFSRENLVLGTAADALWIHCHRDPAKSAANRKACSAATSDYNREHARYRRAIGPLDSLWYAVDVANKRIVNTPAKKRCHVPGGPPPSANGMGWVGWSLGWPALSSQDASVLAAFVDAGCPVSMRPRGGNVADGLAWAVCCLRAARLIEPSKLTVDSLRCACSNLAKAGLLERLKRGTYTATPAAIATRGPVHPYVFVRGAELRERFPGFTLFDPTMPAK